MPPNPSLDPVTPAPDAGNRRFRSTSVRATRGRPTPRRRSNGNATNHEPRKLNLSPEQQQQSAHESRTKEPQLLTLPASLFPHWCILMLCSALCLAAVAGGTPLTTNSSTAESQSETYNYENLQMVMAIATLSLMLTFLAAACYVLIPAPFVGSLYEVTAIGVNIVLQGGNLPIVMNPSNDLAVKGPAIINGNLFVLSWLCFLMSWALLKLVLEQAFCMDQARRGNLVYLAATREGYPPLIPITPFRMANFGLILASLVVLVSSTRDYKQQLCSEWNRQLCKRLQFSISVAVMSLLGLLISWSIYFYHVHCRKIESPASFIPSTRVQLGLFGLLTLGWFLATSVGTFGKHGPGHALGNYFFGVWTSLLLCLYLLKKTLVEHMTVSSPIQANQTEQLQPPRRQIRSIKQNIRIPGQIQEEDPEHEEAEEENVPLSTCATEAMECTTAATSPHISTEPPRLQGSGSRTPRSPRDPMAISLEQSFRNEEDLEQGRHALRYAGTDKTDEDDSEEEYVHIKVTPRRGSALRSITKPPATAQSTATSASQKSDFYHERIKPTTIPFAAEIYSDENEDDDYDDYDALSNSIITAVIDNTSNTVERRGASPEQQRDVLIDPEDFSVNSALHK